MKKYLIAVAALSLFLTACQTATTASSTQATQNKVLPNSIWSTEYGGADKSYDKNLFKLREEIAPRFQVLQFKDEQTGRVMEYNLYTPKNYNPKKRYPLVVFMADASTAGKGVKAPLMQGYGGIIWATDEAQAKNPAFVLVPSFTEKAVFDDWTTSEEVGVALRLIKQTAKQYPIDAKRIYTTGQSMGGMISFYLNSIEPNLFAASMFVGSQWDVNVLAPLAKAKFIYTVSAADPKASKGMNELGEMLKQKGVKIAETEFSAKLPQAEQNQKVKALLAQKQKVNFIRFEPNTVVPEGIVWKGGEHMYSFDYAYQLKPAREWLFNQKRP